MFRKMILGRILCSLVDPFDIVNKFHITFHLLSPRAHAVFPELLFGHRMFELLPDTGLHSVR